MIKILIINKITRSKIGDEIHKNQDVIFLNNIYKKPQRQYLNL